IDGVHENAVSVRVVYSQTFSTMLEASIPNVVSDRVAWLQTAWATSSNRVPKLESVLVPLAQTALAIVLAEGTSDFWAALYSANAASAADCTSSEDRLLRSPIAPVMASVAFVTSVDVAIPSRLVTALSVPRMFVDSDLSMPPEPVKSSLSVCPLIAVTSPATLDSANDVARLDTSALKS